jgi:uncharacterized protein (DUF1499 family)
MRSFVFLIALVIFIATAAFVFRELIYSRLFGSPDQGASDLDQLSRPKAPNSYLMADAERTSAHIDSPAKVVDGTTAMVLEAATKALAEVTDIRRMDDGSDPHYRRFVVRTRLMRFPDTVEFWASPVAGQRGKVSLSAYSRSQIGHADLGANKARIEAVIANLPKALPQP